MTVTVEYGAQLRDAAGTAAERLQVEGACDLRRLLALAADRHGRAFRDLVLDGAGMPRPSNMVLLGGQLLRWDSSRPLQDGDVVAILSPIAGG